ncbi:MAG: Yip1 family protein [Chloroflexota bacterium]
MFERIMGIITLKAPTYKEVAHDEKATMEAAIIVAIVAVIQAIMGLITPGMMGQPSGGVMGAILSVIGAFVIWFVSAWLLAVIAKAFGGKTDTSEMLRVTGYVYVFNLVGLLALLGFISQALLCLVGIVVFVALILSLIGYVIGVREAAEFSTGNAVITALIVVVISWVISLGIGMIGRLLT